jgi:hypothetical protein
LILCFEGLGGRAPQTWPCVAEEPEQLKVALRLVLEVKAFRSKRRGN